MTLTVYCGAQLLEAKDGLVAVYTELFRLDAAIREALLVTAIATNRTAGGSLQIAYRDTVMDEDRLPHYKLIAARFEVVRRHPARQESPEHDCRLRRYVRLHNQYPTS